MTAKYTARLAWRLVLQLLLSALLGLITTYVVLAVLQSLYRSGDYSLRRYFNVLFNILGALLGESSLIYVGTFLFSIVYMVVFSWRKFSYIGQMYRAIEHIAEGHFDAAVPVRQRNELTDLAMQTNRLVERLKRSLDEERRAEQTKNELITNVSHDLRTPLTSILGYLGLIEQDRYRDEVELRHYVSIAYDKSQRLHVLINDLFEYTRMRHGAVSLQRVRINLAEMIGQLLVDYRMPLAEAGMTGTVASSGPDIVVMGDPVKLVRVFENLLSNAMAYGKDGKKIDFAVSRREGEAVVEVTNYGEPIPTTDLPYIFDRFYRVDKSRSENSGGSGLGLAIVKSLVELHGGRIEARSDSSRTSFLVYLPLAAAVPEPCGI